MLEKLLPNEFVDSVFDIDVQELVDRNVKAIITDLDNTLVEWHRPLATPEIEEWLIKMTQAGIQVTVVSNNRQNRVQAFCEPLGINFIWSARKPTNQAFHKAVKDMNVSISETVVIGDQLFTDVLGGNLLGFHTILVVPVAKSDGFFTRFNRKLEKVALYWMKKKGMISWENRP